MNKGMDISNQGFTKPTGEMLQRADYLVTVCGHAGEHCPVLPPGTRKEHWPLNDHDKAAGTEDEIMAVFHTTCGEITQCVIVLLQRLQKEETV